MRKVLSHTYLSSQNLVFCSATNLKKKKKENQKYMLKGRYIVRHLQTAC